MPTMRTIIRIASIALIAVSIVNRIPAARKLING